MEDQMRIRRIILVAALAVGVLATNVVTEESASAAPACNATTATAVWKSGQTLNYAPGHWCMKDNFQEVIFQSDGNLVWYQTHYDHVFWATNTWGNGARRLAFAADGNIVIFGADNKTHL